MSHDHIPETYTTLEVCQKAYNILFGQYETLEHEYEEIAGEEAGHEGHFHAGQGDCEGTAEKVYTLPLHIAAIFIILAVSIIGTAFPIVATHVKKLRVHRYIIILGKCIGIGVVLSVAVIHMLLPAVMSLTSECLPESWREGYEAYPYLFCLLAMIAMQFIDFIVLFYLTHKELKKQTQLGSSSDGITPGGNELKEVKSHDHHHDHEHKHDHGHSHNVTPGNESIVAHSTPGVSGESHCHTGHVHGGLLMDPSALKTIEAYLLEFGITVHSILIGLAVGVVDDSVLRTLLVALCFHQTFEGMALGSRIADAKLTSRWHEALLVAIFSFSAPVGIAIGVGVASSLNVNGVTFLYIQGTFDAVCAGILIYIGLNLMMKDFPEDMDSLCKGKKYELLLRAGLFIAMWFGAAMMAFIGKYL